MPDSFEAMETEVKREKYLAKLRTGINKYISSNVHENKKENAHEQN